MAGKSEFRRDLLSAGRRAGGSHATIEARDYTLNAFVDWCYENGFQLRDVRGIRLRHVKAWLDTLTNLEKRTRHNYMSHLRAALRAAGRSQFARAPELSNRALGIAGGSRIGTHLAPTWDQYVAMLNVVDRQDPGVGACLRLMSALGLRLLEAVMADRHTLLDWKRTLLSEDPGVQVLRGTKGGLTRFTTLQKQVQALEAINHALTMLAKDKRRTHLIQGTLKAARKRASNVLYQCGLRGAFSSHCLRYGWAQRSAGAQVAAGRSEKQSSRVTAMSLGHGQGRDRWLRMVYYSKAAKPQVEEFAEIVSVDGKGP